MFLLCVAAAVGWRQRHRLMQRQKDTGLTLSAHAGAWDRNDDPTPLTFCVVGPSGVGKTAIIDRWMNRRFTAELEATREGTSGSKVVTIGGNQANVTVWDLPGSEAERHLADQYLWSADVVLLVFKVGNESSLLEIQDYWLSKVRNLHARVALVGNQADVYQQTGLEKGHLELWAGKRGWKYYEVTAKNGDSVRAMFNELIKAALSRRLPVAEELPQANVEGFTEEQLMHIFKVARKRRLGWGEDMKKLRTMMTQFMKNLGNVDAPKAQARQKRSLWAAIQKEEVIKEDPVFAGVVFSYLMDARGAYPRFRTLFTSLKDRRTAFLRDPSLDEVSAALERAKRFWHKEAARKRLLDELGLPLDKELW